MDCENETLFHFFYTAAFVTLIKILLIPCYHSTDFEVHRNWLAITSSLPINKWYIESTSLWTLDYPPLFAWFEKFLSLFAGLFDDRMLQISASPYASNSTILFQRFSVIIGDCIFLYAVYRWLEYICFKSTTFSRQLQLINVKYDTELMVNEHDDPIEYRFSSWHDLRTILSVCFLINPALLLIDHIHFQYNGLLLGILLLSLLAIEQDHFIYGSLLFAVLLNMKHIYLYIAPAFFVFILRRYTLDRHFNFSLTKFLSVASVVLSVFLISFGPFYQQLPQVLSRLFPFKRGLTHSYWAPNMWAVYNSIDLVLAKAAAIQSKPGYTSGHVQEFDHLVLPSIKPILTMFLACLFMVPALIHLWRKAYFTTCPGLLFLRTTIICAYSSFLFSWHVHEKAILIILLPMTILVCLSRRDVDNFLILSACASVSTFPLLPEKAETPIYLLLTVCYFVYVLPNLKKLTYEDVERQRSLELFEKLYLLGFLALQFITLVAIPVSGLQVKLPFLKLAITSIYCSIGVVYTFIRSYAQLLSE